jgi:hypothetical protein
MRYNMCLAKIYTNNKNFETLSLIQVLSFSEYVEDTETPTLLIGKKNSEELLGSGKIKVLDREIKKNLTWTYSKIEKRNEYEKDIEEFYVNLFKNIKKRVKYQNIDLYNITYSETKELINIINDNSKKYIYITNNHIYILNQDTVIGISLDEVEYIGVSVDKIKEKIKQNKNNILIFNDYFVENKLKNYLKDNKIIIPYLYSLKNQ